MSKTIFPRKKTQIQIEKIAKKYSIAKKIISLLIAIQIIKAQKKTKKKTQSASTTTPSITTPSIIFIDLQQLISAKATSSKI